MFNKSYFILKISGICIDCTFIKQSIFIKNNNTLISMTRKHWISLLSDFPLKLVTPLFIIIVTLVLSCMSQPKLSGRLGRYAPGKTVYCQCGVHPLRIISNVVLSLSYSSVLKIDELQRRPPKSLSNDHYITVMHALSLDLLFQCFHVCFRWKYSELFLG